MLRALLYILIVSAFATAFKVSFHPNQILLNKLSNKFLPNHDLNVNLPKILASTILSSLVIQCFLVSSPCYADNMKDVSTLYTSVAEIQTSTSMTFNAFLNNLDEGKVGRVVFHGINPTYLTAYYKTGEFFDVKDGFPSYNDPLSQSGPAQAISRVQHSPGVICQQDISDVLMKSTTRKSKELPEPKTMLQHSAYPKELGYNANK